ETVRAYDGKIFRLEDHFDRLFRSATGIRLSIPHTREEFREILDQILKKNKLKDALIRITITRGEGEVGSVLPPSVEPTVVILPRPFAGYPPASYEKGVKIVTIKDQHHFPSGLHPEIKSTSFQKNILVKMQAQQKGADDAVLLNGHGYVMEGTSSNLFIVKEGKIITPSPEVGILEGITRRTVMELAGGRGIPVHEGLLSREELYQADECFLTNTSVEIMPVVVIDENSLGAGHPGPLTIFLMKAFREAVKE
ncbi:MAG TPA: aminotransferase class IV, partial [Nitrospiria bacterium]|nr:aminotransferase class IV [Nitrospiria bacterium]